MEQNIEMLKEIAAQLPKEGHVPNGIYLAGDKTIEVSGKLGSHLDNYVYLSTDLENGEKIVLKKGETPSKDIMKYVSRDSKEALPYAAKIISVFEQSDQEWSILEYYRGGGNFRFL